MGSTREIPQNPLPMDDEQTPLPDATAPCPRCRAQVPTMYRFCGFCGHNLTGSQSTGAVGDPLIGAVVGGKYRLLAKIGAGGMGSVYKVEHVQMGKIMAMKLLHGDLSRDESMIRRFNREARAVSRLTSVNTVQVFDYGQSDGLVYLVMEYLQGRDLGLLLGELGPLDLGRCVDIVSQIAASLSEAHDKGVVHRDLKPENIFLCAPQGGRELVKVLDFGLAKLSEREELGGQTLGGSLIGTPYYMSPEQVSGGAVDNKSDIYGLGALIFKLLTGEPPYSSPHPIGVLTAHLQKPPPVASERLPERAEELRRVDDVLRRAMAKKPADRHNSAPELAQDLERHFTAKHAVVAPKKQTAELLGDVGATLDEPNEAVLTRADWERFESRLKMRRFFSGAGVVVGLAALGGLVWWGVAQENFFKRNAESEPNNRTVDATPVTLGLPMQGALGLPAIGERADQDFFEIRYDGPNGHVLDVNVTGVEGVDIVLEVYDMGGRRMAGSNGAGVGEGEQVSGVQWTGVPLYALVRELWTQGIPPRPAPDSPYTLTATFEARQVGTEKEPNGMPGKAEAVLPGEKRRGVVSEPQDVDLYVLPPVPVDGRLLTVSLMAPPEQALDLTLVDGAGKILQKYPAPAGRQSTVRVFVAPMGRMPLHLGVRAPEGQSGGFKAAQYDVSFEMDELSITVPSVGSGKPGEK